MGPASELPGNRELAAKYPAWKGPLVPRLGNVDVTLPQREILKQITDPTTYIQQAIGSHERNGNVGGFKVVNLGPYGFSIVMDRVTDPSGQMKQVEPVLDTLVTFPEADRTLGETILLLSQAAAAAGKIPFGVGGPGSESFFERTHVQIGATKEPARTVLAKALRSLGYVSYSWNLNTLPGGISILTVRQVSVEVIDARGNVGLQPLTLAPPVAIAHNLNASEPVYRPGGPEGATAPKCTSAEPMYTGQARKAHVQGYVAMDVVIKKDGTVELKKIIAKLGYGLDEEAEKTLKLWKCEAGQINGHPVAVQTRIQIEFRLQ
jgi:TonB family protein